MDQVLTIETTQNQVRVDQIVKETATQMDLTHKRLMASATQAMQEMVRKEATSIRAESQAAIEKVEARYEVMEKQSKQIEGEVKTLSEKVDSGINGTNSRLDQLFQHLGVQAKPITAHPVVLPGLAGGPMDGARAMAR